MMLKHFFCSLVVVALSASTIVAAEWTVFHGPKGDNKSPDTGLLKKWHEGGPTLLWKADFIGFGYSGVTVAGDRIYTSGNVGNDAMVFCLDMEGNEVWKQNNGPAHNNARTYPSTRGTPTIVDDIDGKRVYDVGALGNVTCFDALTGEKIWSRNLMTDYNAPMPRWFFGHSIVVEGDNLICLVGGEKGLAVALDKRTGETVLVFPPTARNAPTSYMTPYFFDFEGMRVLVLMSNETVEGYDAKTAKKLFTIPWRNQSGSGTNITAPIYREGHLFLSTGYELGAKGFRLTKNVDGTITSTELWHEPRFQSHHHGLILVGDYVYGTTQRGEWAAINFLTGKAAYWARPVGEESSVHYADGLIYVLSQDSATVILWNPKPNEFVELSRFTLPEAEGKAWAHPVVIGGRLYLRHAKYLYCYDVRTQQ